MSIYDSNLEPTAANHVPLTPLSFIERTADVYPQHPAVIYGKIRRDWQETFVRCKRLATALAGRGIEKGDSVAVMLPNVPAMLEAHFGVPMTGAVLAPLNVRLDAEAIAFMLKHSEAKVLIGDREFHTVIRDALELLDHPPLVIDVDDPAYTDGETISELDYETLLAEGDLDSPFQWPDNEWDAIALNYTSGTTGNPKGVIYHHRGAFLAVVGNQMIWNMAHHPVYLWTLPMFHCNGWCFPWTVTAMAGTHVFLRKVDTEKIFSLIREHRVSHLCGAPIVLNALVNAYTPEQTGFEHSVNALIAGAAPPAKVIGAVEAMGIKLTHVYGLTEVYGPATVCAWHNEWDAEPAEERARIKARQGVRYQTLEGAMVADSKTLEPVPRDGQTIGEVFLRGNMVMKGYLKNPTATAESFKDGWFHSGDLAVCHPDGYIEIKDRLKDIIISGGENISTIEVEDCLYRHAAVLEAAVVARPNEKWGETPCAFITLKEDRRVDEDDIIAFCRDNLAHFKVPKTVVFSALPKTSTGKIQKNVLRDRARDL